MCEGINGGRGISRSASIPVAIVKMRNVLERDTVRLCLSIRGYDGN
jgi:hypothetical protein